MDGLSFTKLEGLIGSIPWLIVAYFAKRSLTFIEKKINEGEIKDTEIMEVLAKLNTKLEVLAAVVNIELKKKVKPKE